LVPHAFSFADAAAAAVWQKSRMPVPTKALPPLAAGRSGGNAVGKYAVEDLIYFISAAEAFSK